MLRENLDTVLKELLEFKNSERISSTYPGSHLDLVDNFLKFENHKSNIDILLDTIESRSKETLKSTKEDEVQYKLSDNTETVNRIRRFLNKKSARHVLQPKYKSKLHSYLNKFSIFKNHRIKRSDIAKAHKKKKIIKRKFKIKTKEIRVGRKLQTYGHVYKRKRPVRETFMDDDLVKRRVKNDEHDPANGDAAMKARFLFTSCMNYNILEKRAHQPLLDLLNLLGGWPILNKSWVTTKFDWLEQMAKLRLYNNDILISEWVGPDIKNSDEFVIQFDQTSLGIMNPKCVEVR